MGKKRKSTTARKAIKANQKATKLAKSLAKKLDLNQMDVDTKKKKKVPSSKQLQKKKAAVKKTEATEEEIEFRRQQKSLNERMNQKQKATKRRSQPISLAPATFVVDDAKKSTDALVEEAITKVGNIRGIGNQSMIPVGTDAWSVNATADAAFKDHNPWAILEDEESVKTSVSQPIEFAPASFSVGCPVGGPVAALDPDL